jgi:hypothetical protein
MEGGMTMKRYFGLVFIALAAVLSSGAVYGQNVPREVIAEGIVPEEWGTLRGVMAVPGDVKIAVPGAGDARLFFEDSNGTIRTVVLFPNRENPRLYLEGGAIVIRRSK